MNKLRILYLIPELGCGGAEILLGNICREMSKQGHDVKLLTLHNNLPTYINFPEKEEFERIAKPEKINLKTKLSITKSLNVECTELKKIVDEFKPHIIHSHLFLAEIAAHSYIKNNIVYFSHAHDNMFQLEPLHYKTRRKRKLTDYLERIWLLKKYKSTAKHFIAISDDTYHFWKRVLPKKLHANITKLHNGIDYNKFKSLPKTINPNQKIIIVSTGSLVPKKNHALLIELARLLKNKNLQFEIRILGNGFLMNSLKEKTLEYNLQNEVLFLGNVGNVSEELKNANIYVHPATYEPFGLAILEAMASGLPVIAMNGHGNIELNVEGKTGFLIHENNPGLFVDKLMEVISNPTLYQEISKYVIEFSSNFNMYNYCLKLTELYKQSISKI